MKQRFKATPAVYLFLIQDNKILLSLRRNTGFMDGLYSVPSGHVESNESPKSTMQREAKEEIGITLDLKDLQFIHLVYRSKYDSAGEYMDMFFKADTWHGTPKNMEPEKCENIEWFPLNKLPQNIIPYVKDVIEDYHKKVYYSELGWKVT